ncbi:MAG: SulP family inorganic anion transporter [Actinomycetota bacterium]|nr:SulP family inorganic anion transporter [Actinomycetota bacterium]
MTDAVGPSRDSVAARSFPFPLLQGVLPLTAKRVPKEALAGLSLAALGIPEVLGYARIAGMPIETGLYTLLLPMAVFAVLGSSRHLVVGADSATAAILAAGVAALAIPGSPRYVQLVALVTLVTGAFLVFARVARLGFLANFLSRTVLVGFLSGVGLSVAIGQLPALLGVTVHADNAIGTLIGSVAALSRASLATVGVAGAVLLGVPLLRRVAKRVPAALLAVTVSITVSALWNLPSHGVTAIGHVPGGLPPLRVPSVTAHDTSALAMTAVSMAAVILAQSVATARAYANVYNEDLDPNADLLALGAANGVAALTGSFVVNGSPTKTQMVDSAGGRTQLAQLSCSVVVLLVLLFATAPLAHLSVAVLAAVVFLIGVELIDIKGLAEIMRVRRIEFTLGILTAAAVVVFGVEQAIALAMLASIVDHLRHGYAPRTQVLTRQPGGHWLAVTATAEVRTREGLVIYRFPSSLYYASAHKLAADLAAFASSTAALDWFCIDCTALSDIDFTAAQTLRRAIRRFSAEGARVVFSGADAAVLEQLTAYGLLTPSSPDCYPTPGAVLDAYEACSQSTRAESRRLRNRAPRRGPSTD